MIRGRHAVAWWSKSQATVALSSGEAEYNACAAGLAEQVAFPILAARSLWQRELGARGLSMGTGCVAAKGILNRVGSGAVKHMSVKQMWGQQLVRQHQVRVYKIARDDNVSYVLDSTASLDKSSELLERVGIQVVRIEDCLALRNKGG